MKLKNNGQRGFTLIELLVVIAIIGVLASVVLVSLNNARDKSRYARVISDMKQIATASELDYNENNSFAADVNPDNGSRLVPAFISQWPKPPCSGWTYDWDNWESIGASTSVRVTIRRTDVNAVYYFCIKQGVDCSWGGGADITMISPKIITCRE